MLDKLGIPKEPPKGSFYDFSSDEQPAGNNDQGKKRTSGGQPGNQNARKHGLYSKHLPAERHGEYGSLKSIRDLSNEITLLRLKIIEQFDDPDTYHDHLIKSLNTLARLTDIQERNLYMYR